MFEKEAQNMDAILIFWNRFVDYAHFVWVYMQTRFLDLLSGYINQDTAGVILVISGIVLVLLIIIIAAFKRSKPHVNSIDMMASLTMLSVINSTPKAASKPENEYAASAAEPDLKTIETNMKALKELYEAGKIKADLYISESRHFYEVAKAIYYG